MLETMIYPWQTAQWEQVWQSRQSSRLAHALLFVGMSGLGKSHFAYSLARAILCQKPVTLGVACQACHSCRLFLQQSHPDWIVISPEESAKTISVDQIRELVQKTNETTLLVGFRVILIQPANRMNMNAANALLKTLEEPVANTLFILITDHGLRLPATIMSRCQKILFHAPAAEVAAAWLKVACADDTLSDEKIQLLLKLADGAPLKAFSLLDNNGMMLRQDFYQGLSVFSEGRQNPLAMAAKWQEQEPLVIVDYLMSWITDLLRFQVTRNANGIVHDDFREKIIRNSLTVAASHLLAMSDHLQQLRAVLLTGISLNKQLVFEDIFIRWGQYVSR